MIRSNAAKLFNRQVSKRISADHRSDFLYSVVTGDQIILRIDICPIVAWKHEGWSRDPDMHLLGARVPQQIDDPADGRSTNNGIVKQKKFFSIDKLLNRNQLHVSN